MKTAVVSRPMTLGRCSYGFSKICSINYTPRDGRLPQPTCYIPTTETVGFTARFGKGEKGNLISRFHGKAALIQSGFLLKPGLAEVELIEEAPRYGLVRVLGEAAMLDMMESAEEKSVRLATARRLFGDYDLRMVTSKSDEPTVTFYWRGMSQEAFDTKLKAELRQHQRPLPRRRWTN